MSKIKDWFVNLWWNLKYWGTNTTKERHNGHTVSCRGSAEKARGKR